jgi:translation elongation factor EF-G
MKFFSTTLLCLCACMSYLEIYTSAMSTAQDCLTKFYTDSVKNNKDKEKNDAKNNLEACLASTGIGGTIFGDHEDSFRIIDAARVLSRTNQELQKILDVFEDNAHWRNNVQKIVWYATLIGLNVAARYYLIEEVNKTKEKLKKEITEEVNKTKEELKKDITEEVNKTKEELKKDITDVLTRDMHGKLGKNFELLKKKVIEETASKTEQVLLILQKKLLSDPVTIIKYKK